MKIKWFNWVTQIGRLIFSCTIHGPSPPENTKENSSINSTLWVCDMKNQDKTIWIENEKLK